MQHCNYLEVVLNKMNRFHTRTWTVCINTTSGKLHQNTRTHHAFGCVYFLSPVDETIPFLKVLSDKVPSRQGKKNLLPFTRTGSRFIGILSTRYFCASITATIIMLTISFTPLPICSTCAGFFMPVRTGPIISKSDVSRIIL